MQLPLVFNAIERYEKDMALCTCWHAVGRVKTDNVDRCTWSNPRNCGVVYSIEKKLINQLASYF